MRWVAVSLLALTSCSLTTATGFTECKTDVDCKDTQACVESYCINLTAGCKRQTGEFASADRVIFAATLPLSSAPDGGGTIDQSEQQGLNALALAIEEGNLRDGIKGRKFALLFCNTGGDDALAKQQVEWLATELKVPAVVTSGSGQTIAITNVAASRDVMVISATSTSPELIGTFQSNKQLVWRTAPSDSLQARVMADLIQTTFPVTGDAGTADTRIGIAYVNTTYGQGLSAGLRARLPARFQVKEVFYELNDDITQAVNDLNAFAPALTMVVGFPPDLRNIVTLAKTKAALNRASGHRWLFSDSAKDPALLTTETLPELAGSFGTAPAQGAGSTFPSFRDRFITKYSADPTSFSFTSHSYDAMYLLMLSAAWASNGGGAITGPRMVDGMKNVSMGAPFSLAPGNFTGAVAAMQAKTPIDVEGASGKLNFDSDAGAPSSPYELWRIEPDGGLSTTALVEPTGN